MKGILKKNNGNWYIVYIDWTYQFNNKKAPIELTVELDPSDASDAELLCGTERTLENKEVRFSFREIEGTRYAKLKNPNEEYQLDEIEQEIFNQTFKDSIKKYPTIDSRISKELGNKCLVCEKTIKLSEVKQMCDDCLNALKTLILEKRTQPK